MDLYGKLSELKQQEDKYREAHTRLVEAHTHFDDEVKALYKVGCQAMSASVSRQWNIYVF